MKDLIAYLQAQIDNNQSYIMTENNRERGVDFGRIDRLYKENSKIKGWIKEINASLTKVDSAGSVTQQHGMEGVWRG